MPYIQQVSDEEARGAAKRELAAARCVPVAASGISCAS